MGADWLQRLRTDELVLLDGGTGSELARRGVSLDGDVWSGRAAVRHLQTLRDIHADYIAAGAEIITTNTFATSRFVLDAGGLGDRFETINRGAVDAALEARARSGRHDVAIAGALSCFPPRFDVGAYPEPEQETAAYRELAQLLADCGVDLIALEMLEDTTHAACALAGALETGLPVTLGVSGRVSPSGEVVAYDFPRQGLAAVLDTLLDRPPSVVSVMHTPPADVGAGLDVVAARWRGPLGAYPEIPLADDGATTLQPAELVELAASWVRRGARLLGGCCGSRPAHIAALREALPRLRAARGVNR